MQIETNNENYASLIGALRETYIADCLGCCGAGRHLVVKTADGQFAYLHDSATQRSGDPAETGEDRVVCARRCSKEDVYDAATEGMDDADFDNAYMPERDHDGALATGERARICREWAEETLSNMDDDQILAHYNVNQVGDFYSGE